MKEIIPHLPIKETPVFETMNTIVTESGPDAIRIIRIEGGSFSFLTDIGYKQKKNEDALTLCTAHKSFAVIDGMGGMRNGTLATRIVAEELQRTFDQKTPLKDAHSIACQRMRKENDGGGACYTAFRIQRRNIEIIQGGDTGLIIANTKDGAVKFDSSQELSMELQNGVHRDISMPETTWYIGLENSDRLYLFSDGVSDNISRNKLIQETFNLPVDEAVRYIHETVRNTMGSGAVDGKPDNISILIFDKQAL